MNSQVERRSIVSLSKLRRGSYSISSILATVFCNLAIFSNLLALLLFLLSNSLLVASNKISVIELYCILGLEKASMSVEEIKERPNFSKLKESSFSECFIWNLLFDECNKDRLLVFHLFHFGT